MDKWAAFFQCVMEMLPAVTDVISDDEEDWAIWLRRDWCTGKLEWVYTDYWGCDFPE